MKYKRNKNESIRYDRIKDALNYITLIRIKSQQNSIICSTELPTAHKVQSRGVRDSVCHIREPEYGARPS